MKTITLAHSELTGTIYAIIGREKVDITDQAIAEVKAIKALEQETVSKEVYDNEHFARKEAEQKLWELQQDVSEDCVSRQAVIEYIKDCNAELMHDIENEAVREDILDMPPVTPKIPTSDDCVSRKEVIRLAEQGQVQGFEWQIRKLITLSPVIPTYGTCKDCKWWNDSDGTYKRGVRAESKCPINTKTVYLGDGYCYKFEQKMENEEYMTTAELMLIAIIKASTKEKAVLFLQDYIQRNGPVSNEAGDKIKMLLEQK